MRLGAPEDFLSASYADFEDIPNIKGNGINRLMNSLDSVGEYENRLKDFTSDGIDVHTYLDSGYPSGLRDISDPPPIVYIKGEREALSARYIAVVGTTEATQEGIRFTIDMAREFVKRGFGIVSGMATGIDSAAHLAALKENGTTLAVLGCGFYNIYPEENISLSEMIVKDGALVSEHSPHRGVSRPNLVLRNRIISALSEVVIVSQVGEKTAGELRTAAYAVKQAKPLFYGNPDGSLDSARIDDFPGVVINGVESVDEILKYVV
jgi:DNA processing protein